MPSIRLSSSEGEVFLVETLVAKQSGIIKQMMEDLNIEEDNEEPVPLINVNSATLNKVIQW